MADSFLVFTCNSTSCGRRFKMKCPKKGGIYPVTCPHCKNKMIVKIPDSYSSGASTEKATQMDNSNSSAIKIKDILKVGTKYSILCPHCKKVKIGYTPTTIGQKGFGCPSCHGKIIAEATGPTYIVKGFDTSKVIGGKIVIVKKWRFNKSFPLKEGNNVIGRFDREFPSDISIHDDVSVSRRSIEIQVRKSEKGYFFKLKVLKATNPVIINNVQYMDGEAVSLNFGDRIIVGRTHLLFDKDI